jgi:hypothetical protein
MYMHEFSPVYTPFLWGMFGLIFPIVLAIVLFTIILKGYALWFAARGGQRAWFVALLVINTMGILEIVYLLFFRPHAPYAKVVSDVTKNAPPVPPSSAK